MFNFEQIKQQIDYEYNYGIKDFEITGGEPSEYKNLRQICQYIKNKNPNSKIAIITNGGLYNCDIWDLIDEVLISYHLGKNDTSYDKQMFPNGSTFKKVQQTLVKAKEYNKLIRTNTVIGTFNFNGIKCILEDLIAFKPHIINFLPVNLFDEAQNMGKYIDYAKLRPLLKLAIDQLNAYLPNTLKFIRYIPFCDMINYEQYIVGHLQHIYDWFDWNVELNGISVIEYSQNNKNLGLYGSTSVSGALRSQQSLYEKTNACLNCKYFLICDGVEKNYGLTQYIKPQHGMIVKNILAYLNNKTYHFYKKWYK